MNARQLISTLTMAAAAAGLSTAAWAEEKMRVGADVGFAPHVMAKPTGGYEGFNVDLIEEIGRRMGVTFEIVNIPYSGIFAAMDAGTVDFVIAPTTANKDRASKVLISEGYLNNDYRFIVRAGGATINSLEDLKGKKIAVNRGNSNDVWLTENQAKYGYEIIRFGSNPDALQAVMSGQADANLAGSTVAAWVTRQTPQLKPAYTIKTGFTYTHPFRKGDVKGRERFELALECVKQDGTLAKLYQKWFNEAPPAGEASTRVVAGFGEPDLEGYDPKPHTLQCKK